MNKTSLLLSTAVGLALIAPCATIAGARHAPAKGGTKASVDFAKMPFKTSKDQPPNGCAKCKFGEVNLVETFAPTSPRSFTSGFLPEDNPIDIKCKIPCTLVTVNTVQALSYYSYNQIAICPLVDGYFTNGSCYFSGALSFQDLYANRTNQTNLAVDSGTHTAQTYLYLTAPAYIGRYQNDYHLYEDKGKRH